MAGSGPSLNARPPEGAGAVFFFGRGNGNPAGTALSKPHLSKPKMKLKVLLGRKRETNTRNRTEEQDYQFCLLASSHILSVTTLVILNLLFIKSCSVNCSIKRKQLTNWKYINKDRISDFYSYFYFLYFFFKYGLFHPKCELLSLFNLSRMHINLLIKNKKREVLRLPQS